MTSRGQRSRPRRPAHLDQRKKILAVCEGKVTEPEYLKGLRRHFRSKLLEIETIGGVGVPMSVVDEAIAAKQRSDRLPRKHRAEKYDEVWAVFDRDDHPLYKEAQQKAHNKKIHCANSDPSFELWLLLHFQDQTAPVDRKAARQKLKQHLPQYDKHVDFELLAAGLDKACLRAKHLRQRAKANKTDGNPSTKVNLLVDSARAGAIP